MIPYLLALRHTPSILQRVVDDVPADRLGEQVAEDRFTLLEMVCHLADFEDVVLERMRAAQKKDGVEMPDWDESQRAIDKRYHARDLREELTVFANRRRDTVDFLEDLSEEDSAKSFSKPGLGRVTIKEYLAVVMGHDLYHLEQATWYLKGVHGAV